MNLSAIFSKTGKGVQEASGKTSQLSRADRTVLSAIDGKTPLSEVQKNFEKLAGPKFEALIQQLDKDGFIREVSSGAPAAAPTARPQAPAAKTAPPPKAASSDASDGLDFTQAVKLPPKAPAAAAPKAPPVDLAATARAGADRKAQEDLTLDYRARQELQAKMKVESDAKAKADAKARVEADARAKAAAEARTAAEEKAASEARAAAMAKLAAEEKAAAEAKSRAEADSRTHAEAEAKVKAAREAAVRMATEAKARAEADAKAKTDAAERAKAQLEAELNAKLDAERKAREDAERRATEAGETARRELEEKAKRDAEQMRQRLEAEMKAKLDAERKAREEEDRKRREEDDRRRKEEDERRAKEDAERRAREEADRKKREDEDRKRKEDDERRRREDDDRRAKEDAERKKREEDERRKREEEDRRRKEDEARRAKEEAERKAKNDAERKAKDDAERKAKDDAERRAKDEAEAKTRAAASSASLPAIEPVAPPPPPAAPAASGGFGDSLLADLDSFGKREEEEQKAKEEAERKAKDDAERRAKEEAARRAKEEAEKKRREEEERRRKEDEERHAKEEAERQEREEEARRKEEEAERKRKAKEALAAKQAEERSAKAAAGAKAVKGAAKAAAEDDDIGVTDDDLDTDDLKRDQKVAAEKARKAAREAPPVAVASGRPKKWGKPAAVALFLLLIAGVGVLHVMPLSTAEYEKAASGAMGVPVKISSAHLSVITGIEVKLEGVSIGDAVKIRMVRGTPEVGSLFGVRKTFSHLDLEGVSITQAQIGDALLGKVAGENFRVARITAKQLALDGPLKIPPLDLDATVADDGTLQAVKLTGADKFSLTLAPKGSEIGFELSAGSLALPFVPALSLSDFGMKGSANRAGVINSEFDGRAYDGVISGTARIGWGANWTAEGEVRARGVKAAVFAPTLVSDGRIEGKAAYSMAGSAPATLYESARMQGEFKIEKGVLGSFDLTRALQTGGAQSGGRTVFNELNGQGLYDKGTVQISNASISAGAMNAGLSLNIDASGGLSGRVVADVKTPSQTLRVTLNISGKVQDPVIRK